ncbi:MAG: hypothetical protein JO075_10210 [Acidimicrobiia bacterium]|nr:hypothetical protein [Acidimicrobiia bacterium]
MPGIPVGPGTVFYLLAALAMPVVGVARRLTGRGGSAPATLAPAMRQMAVAIGMLLTGVLSLWVFDRVGQLVDGSHARAALLLSSPLLIALLVLAVMAVLSRLLRKIARRPELGASDP